MASRINDKNILGKNDSERTKEERLELLDKINKFRNSLKPPKEDPVETLKNLRRGRLRKYKSILK